MQPPPTQQPRQIEEQPPPGQSTAQPIEGLKSELELLKQMTTLNAGSIVIIGTFLKDIFPGADGAPLGGWLTVLIAVAFVLFGISLGWSAACMYAVSGRISTGVRFESTRKASLILGPPLLFFVSALVFFGIAVVSNLVRNLP